MRQRRGCGLFVSIEAGRSPDAERIVRRITARVRSHLALYQRRAGMRRAVATTVFEARGGDKLPKFGAHIVGIMPDAAARDRVVAGLNTSRAHGRNILAEPVTDWAGLAGYLCKEATPQAAYRKGIRRVGGSIPLGELGGNRVIVSEDLRDILVLSGRVEPYRRTYAKRPRARRQGCRRSPLSLLAAGARRQRVARIRVNVLAALGDDYDPHFDHVRRHPRR